MALKKDKTEFKLFFDIKAVLLKTEDEGKTYKNSINDEMSFTLTQKEIETALIETRFDDQSIETMTEGEMFKKALYDEFKKNMFLKDLEDC
jgi:hypothetical protein